MAVAYFVVVVIIGAWIMPTLLIAVITASTEDSRKQIQNALQVSHDVQQVHRRLGWG